MSSLADPANYDDYAAMAAAASVERAAQLACDRAVICHASEATINRLADGILAGVVPVTYDPRQGWLIGDLTVAAWVRQQQGEV